MATARRQPAVAEVTKTVVVTTAVPEKVILELTREEARVLRTVTGAILGSNTGKRGTTNDIYEALEEAGVLSYGTPAYTGNINFKD